MNEPCGFEGLAFIHVVGVCPTKNVVKEVNGRMGERVQSLTVLMVANLKKSQDFYQNVLGCDVTDFWAIRDDVVMLGFKLLQASDTTQIKPNSHGKGHIWDTYAYADDFATLDQLYNEWESKGAKVVQPPTTTEEDWGLWREFAIVDPDGYVLGVGTAKKED